MTVREALTLFRGVSQSHRALACARRGRLRLSAAGPVRHHSFRRRSATLETRRASHAGRRFRGSMYIFDEPTTGLHFDDIQKLLTAFRKLLHGEVSRVDHRAQSGRDEIGGTGSSILARRGEAGGRVVAAGTPEQVARNSQSLTGKFLAPVLNGRNGIAHASTKHASAASGGRHRRGTSRRGPFLCEVTFLLNWR